MESLLQRLDLPSCLKLVHWAERETPVCGRQTEGDIRRILAKRRKRREPHDAPVFPPEHQRRDGRTGSSRTLHRGAHESVPECRLPLARGDSSGDLGEVTSSVPKRWLIHTALPDLALFMFPPPGVVRTRRIQGSRRDPKVPGPRSELTPSYRKGFLALSPNTKTSLQR